MQRYEWTRIGWDHWQKCAIFASILYSQLIKKKTTQVENSHFCPIQSVKSLPTYRCTKTQVFICANDMKNNCEECNENICFLFAHTIKLSHSWTYLNVLNIVTSSYHYKAQVLCKRSYTELHNKFQTCAYTIWIRKLKIRATCNFMFQTAVAIKRQKWSIAALDNQFVAIHLH